MNFPQTVALDVTQDDILLGETAADSQDYEPKWECPIAWAMYRAFPGCEVGVTREYIAVHEVRKDGYGYSSCYYHVPTTAGDFMQDFDDNKTVTPLAFTMTMMVDWS